MNRLAYIIVFTKHFEATQRFYADGLGLEIRSSQDGWTEFDTLGAQLAVHEMADDERQGAMMRFESANLVRDMSTLLSRGVRFDGDIVEFGAGRLVNLFDPEDNLITLFEPAEPIASGLGPAVGRVILNCEDFAESVAFYRDLLGLEVVREAEHWVEFDTGLTRLALHARPADQQHPEHAQQPMAWTIETDDLDDTVDGARHRGLHFIGATSTAEFGRYAELRDPDGRIVVLREPPSDQKEEERLAAAFEDDAAPRRAAMHKPLLKAAKAVSRVVVKPGYKTKKRAAKKRPGSTAPRAEAAKGAKRAKTKLVASSARGAGKDHARAKPRRGHDAKRAKAKPATGRLKKAERKSVERKKTAVARASRSRPIKKAAANRGRRAR